MQVRFLIYLLDCPRKDGELLSYPRPIRGSMVVSPADGETLWYRRRIHPESRCLMVLILFWSDTERRDIFKKIRFVAVEAEERRD